MTGDEPRPINLPLMTGLVALPVVFVWFLLRAGYARSTRVAAFTYLLTVPVLSVIAHLLAAL